MSLGERRSIVLSPHMTYDFDETMKSRIWAMSSTVSGIKLCRDIVRIAKAIGSEKRMQEAKEAYKVAMGLWPHEQRIGELWEWLV